MASGLGVRPAKVVLSCKQQCLWHLSLSREQAVKGITAIAELAALAKKSPCPWSISTKILTARSWATAKDIQLGAAIPIFGRRQLQLASIRTSQQTIPIQSKLESSGTLRIRALSIIWLSTLQHHQIHCPLPTAHCTPHLFLPSVIPLC